MAWTQPHVAAERSMEQLFTEMFMLDVKVLIYRHRNTNLRLPEPTDEKTKLI